MKIKLFCTVLCLCLFTACEEDNPIIPGEPVVPPTEQPEEPDEPEQPEEPDNPQEPISTDCIINWNNEFIIVGGNNMATVCSGDWNSICKSNNMYVVIGTEIKSTTTAIGYSNNGTDWTKITKPFLNANNCICYGDGKFVAVGSNSSCAYSNDGINWNTTNLPDGHLNGVCYGDGKFVAVGQKLGSTSGYMAYSTDGVNWTSVNHSFKNLYCISYINGKFIAAGDRYIYTSTDLNSWEEKYFFGVFRSICYGDGKFVAVGHSTQSQPIGKIFYKTDETDWSTALSNYTRFYGVCFSNGKFVCVGNDVILSSSDGINWTEVKVQDGTRFTACCLF